jgi:hypothetical protein
MKKHQDARLFDVVSAQNADSGKTRRGGSMELPQVTYCGFSLIPLVVFDHGEYIAMLIMRHPNGEEMKTDVLGRFSCRSGAYKFAIDYGIAEVVKLLPESKQNG